MIVLITGASHTGKTALAQKLLEKYKYSYLSEDHLKMGLIRSGYTNLTPLSEDEKLREYLWPVVREIIKTAIENKQNLIIEGCYIPLDYEKDFEPGYLKDIRCFCLVMTRNYITTHFDDIKGYGNIIEKRIDDEIKIESLIKDNENFKKEAQKNGTETIIIDDKYNVEIVL